MIAQIKRRFDGKVAFITGGGTGIGLATAIAFAKEGANVVITGSSDNNLQAGLAAIREQGGKAIAIRCNVQWADDIQAALNETITKYGRLDFAFNNAGVEQTAMPLDQISEGELDRQISINLSGVFLSMKYQIPLMLSNGGGAIVNVSSGAGVKGFAGQAAYCATKFAVIGMTKAAALDYATRNIRINVVAPGIIDTPMMGRFTGGTEEGRKRAVAQEPVGRAGKPEEIASAVLWLCSDGAGFTTGTTLVVDGGQTI